MGKIILTPLNWIFKKFSRTKFWYWFASKIMANFTFRFMGYPNFPMEEYETEILPRLAASMEEDQKYIYVFTSVDTKSLAAKAIRWVAGAYWSHAGLIFPETNHIVHMKGKGISEDHILDLLREVDSVSIGRFPVSDAGHTEYLRRVEKYQRLKAVYDFQQELEDDGILKIYCSELVWMTGRGLVDKETFKPREELGRLIFEPDDVYNNEDKIYEYKV